MRYLTPTGYRNQGRGTPRLASRSDAMLHRLIASAEGAIDAYMGWDLALGGFNPHVTFSQQGFDLSNRQFAHPVFPVPVRNIQRYRIHVSNADPSGDAFVATINPGDAVINNQQGYIEIVPLEAVTYSLTPALLQLALDPPITEVDAEVGFYLADLGAPLVNDSADLLTYGGLHQFWATTYTQAISNQPNTLPPIPAVIYVNGVVQPTSAYTLNPAEGTVTFLAKRGPNDYVTADYTYTIPDLVAEACIEQVTWLLQRVRIEEMGGGGMEFVRAGDEQYRLAKTDDAEEDQLCAKARLRLEGYKPIPIA